ncbi:MAG: chemotaxis protein [Spirochaetes bacterium]|nr:chemotaxis protein [Spirochaetota bacterium]HOD15613.1 methyl-accepting chemotaxis protein [Spirochaetota bacterium]
MTGTSEKEARVESAKSAASLDKTNFTKSKIFSDIIIQNNKRLLYVFLSIMIIANVAVSAIKVAGIGSQYLEYYHIGIEIGLVAILIGITIAASNAFKGTSTSGYIMITGITICTGIFEYTFHGAPQLFAARYIPLALSVFYFNTNISIYTLVLVVVSQIIMFFLRPEHLTLLMPGGQKSDVAVRFILFFVVGLGAIFGARATKMLLRFAIEMHTEANGSLANLRNMAQAIMSSMDVLKKETVEHNTITHDMNDISQHQAAALEEITTSLEELASNSNTISDIARSLYEELEITVDSVNDLKSVNDKVQASSQEMNRSLNEVTEYSRVTEDQIRLTENRFETVKNKSSEMANFVQVINDIADKVNLLSLNAAIEAARAGDAGRGFAVVADEISKLADATTSNAKEIENIIKDNLQMIDESGQLINRSVDTMSKLNNAIVTIKDEITEVGNLITDIGVTIKTIKNLNIKIHESSKTIENSTHEQKIATDESTKTAFDIAQKSQDIVNISIALARSTATINELTQVLDQTVKEMLI